MISRLPRWVEYGAFALSLLSLEQGLLFGHCLASAACGLQNALVTTYSGAVVRTTHVTGVFTDLGLMLGSMLRGRGSTGVIGLESTGPSRWPGD